jgi:hypothetical protein
MSIVWTTPSLFVAMCRTLPDITEPVSPLDRVCQNAYKCLPMSEKTKKEKPLSSWKEIAAYLGCDERTCLRWEKKFRLPVHRVGNAQSKSHVYAYQAELDQWLRGRKDLGKDLSPEDKPSLVRRLKARPVLVAIGLAAVGILLLVAFLGPRLGRPPQPDDFRIDGSRLIVLGRDGRELWRYDTGLENLCDDGYYRDHFQTRKIIAGGSRTTPNLLITDINRDGRDEVLFSLQTLSNFERSAVFCFDDRGRELWKHDAGRDRPFGGKRYAPQYGVQAVDVFSPGPGRENLVMIIAYQHPEFPTYAAFLTPRGKLIGEYWNSGRLSDYVFADVDGDGRKDVVLAGTNNEYWKACLVVLDPENAWGASPQTGEYKSDDLPPGTEKYYLLFPRTEVDKVETRREAFDFIDIFGQDRLVIRALTSGIFFRLTFRLELDAVIDSDSYWEKYRKYQDAGKIPPGKPDPEKLRRELDKGVLYWDGSGWVSTATMNKKNRTGSDPGPAH